MQRVSINFEDFQTGTFNVSVFFIFHVIWGMNKFIETRVAL